MSQYIDLRATIEKYASLYGSDPEELYKVMMCESSGRTGVYGDGGLAYSVFQFHKPTFKEFSKLLAEDLDYYSAHDQIKLASYVFSLGNKYKKHWTCSRIVGIL